MKESALQPRIPGFKSNNMPPTYTTFVSVAFGVLANQERNHCHTYD